MKIRAHFFCEDIDWSDSILQWRPPFTDVDPMKMYTLILNGIEKVDFPSHMSRSAVTLIKKLCRLMPNERLGYQRGGIEDIRKHKYASFDLIRDVRLHIFGVVVDGSRVSTGMAYRNRRSVHRSFKWSPVQSTHAILITFYSMTIYRRTKCPGGMRYEFTVPFRYYGSARRVFNHQ